MPLLPMRACRDPLVHTFSEEKLDAKGNCRKEIGFVTVQSNAAEDARGHVHTLHY